MRVNGIAVGSVMTSALEFVAGDPATKEAMEAATPLRRIGEVEDIAATVVFLASQAGGYLTGKVVEVDGGLSHPNPLARPGRPGARRCCVIRVVEWSTGTVGRHAVAGILARPELELVGVWVSSEAKHGRDVGELCGGSPMGLAATMHKDELVALRPDVVVHTAMTDADPFAAVELFRELLAAGINVVSSGPVFLQFPHGVIPDEMVAQLEEAGRVGNASLHVNGIDPGFANDGCRWC